MTVQEIYDGFHSLYPFDGQCEWDNSGLQVGDFQQEVKKVVIALDPSLSTIQMAVEEGADLIVTHHPLMFRPVKNVLEDDFIGKKIRLLIQHDISILSMHTSYDATGMRSAIDAKLPFAEAPSFLSEEEHIGSVGDVRTGLTVEELVSIVCEEFDLTDVHVSSDDLLRHINRLAVCGGSGKSELSEVVRAGADVYLTGDIDHHTFLDATEQGVIIIDAGHFGLEHVFKQDVASVMEKTFPQLEVKILSEEAPYLTVQTV